MAGPHALLEPEVAAVAGSLENQHHLLAAHLSIAITLKRIADDHRDAERLKEGMRAAIRMLELGNPDQALVLLTGLA